MEKIKCRLCGNVFDKNSGNSKMLNCCDRLKEWHEKIEKYVDKNVESEKDFIVC